MPTTILQLKKVVALLQRAAELKREQSIAVQELETLSDGIIKMLPLGEGSASGTIEVLASRSTRTDNKPTIVKQIQAKKKKQSKKPVIIIAS